MSGSLFHFLTKSGKEQYIFRNSLLWHWKMCWSRYLHHCVAWSSPLLPQWARWGKYTCAVVSARRWCPCNAVCATGKLWRTQKQNNLGTKQFLVKKLGAVNLRWEHISASRNVTPCVHFASQKFRCTLSQMIYEKSGQLLSDRADISRNNEPEKSSAKVKQPKSRKTARIIAAMN